MSTSSRVTVTVEDLKPLIAGSLALFIVEREGHYTQAWDEAIDRTCELVANYYEVTHDFKPVKNRARR